MNCPFAWILSQHGCRTFPPPTVETFGAFWREFAGLTCTAACSYRDAHICPGRTIGTGGYLLGYPNTGGSNRVAASADPRCTRKRERNNDGFDGASGFRTVCNHGVADLVHADHRGKARKWRCTQTWCDRTPLTRPFLALWKSSNRSGGTNLIN